MATLVEEVIKEEIEDKDVFFAMDNNKFLGLDRYGVYFFNKAW